VKNILKEALKNKKLAATILGQVIVDEGYIGTDTITIRYNSKENAKAIWSLAKKWDWTNTFQKHNYIDNRKPNEIKTAWRFSLKKSAIREIYSIIGRLPDKKRDEKIRLILRQRRKIGVTFGKGVTRQKIIDGLKKSPHTIEEFVKKLNLTNGAIRYHLKSISKTRNLKRKRINGYGKQLYYF